MKRAVEKRTFQGEGIEDNMCTVQNIPEIGNERLEKQLGMSFYEIVLASIWTYETAYMYHGITVYQASFV